MTCSQAMKKDIEGCRTEEPVESATERMKRCNVGFWPSCADTDAIVGTISDRDLAMRILAERRSAVGTFVQDVMCPELVCCSPDDEQSAAQAFTERYTKSRRLP